MTWGPALGQLQQWEQDQWNQLGGDLCAITKAQSEWTTVGKGRKSNKIAEGMQKTGQSGSQYNKFSELETDSDSEDENECQEKQKVRNERAKKPNIAKMPRKAKLAVKFGRTLCVADGRHNTECESLNFNEQATMIRERCKAERTEARGRRMSNGVVICQESQKTPCHKEETECNTGNGRK